MVTIMENDNWTLVKTTKNEIVFNSIIENLTVKLLDITNTGKDDFTMAVM